jgi:hypothetical protein
MSRGTPARSDASGSGFQGQGTLFGRDPKQVFEHAAKTFFGEEPEKQRPAVPQNRGPLRAVFVHWGDGTPVKPRARARFSEDRDPKVT